MVFSSIFFSCIFLPIMLIGYYVLPNKAKNIWLLLGSLVFYVWGGPKYFAFLVASILINYIFGLLIAKTADKTHPADERGNSTYHTSAQRALIIIAIVLNIGSLVYFKYAVMLIETIRDLCKPELLIPEIIMPLGISFYTFQCISYVVDVYRREGAVREDGSITTLVCTNPINFALFVSFFPQLLQGPIIRYPDTKYDLENKKITLDDFTIGVERFIIGLAKKALIANTLGEVADKIFACEPTMIATSVAWLGAILYTLQIYFDFSGYTDMAIGLGRMFGFHFCENFNYPYISKSITEFWRRWHMSLSSWFRDYLYIPLGGNRKGNVYINLIIVFLATGIWHGAAWGFLVWGLWHGLFMLIERAVTNKKKSASKNGYTSKSQLQIFVIEALKWLYTIVAVTLGWVLFKLEELPLALSYIGSMFNIGNHGYTAFSIWYYVNSRLVFFMIIAVLACIPWAQILPRHAAGVIVQLTSSDKGVFKALRYICLGLLLVISMVFVINNTYSPFIYFRF